MKSFNGWGVGVGFLRLGVVLGRCRGTFRSLRHDNKISRQYNFHF